MCKNANVRRPKRTREQTLNARDARQNSSVAEQIAWKLLRRNQLGFSFKREFPVGNYRLDFYCAEAKLAIEFDGEQHDPKRDAIRDAYLAQFGILVFRIPNREFFQIEGEGKMKNHFRDVVQLCEQRSGRKAFPN